MIEQCKWKVSQVNPFIPLLQIAPGAIWILVTDQQLKNMACFHTNSEEFLIVGINTKFNLEKLSVAVIANHHLLSKSSGESQ